MKETIESLAKAFIGESQARNRYTFYSKIAKKEGYEQIAGIFLLTADQEKEHASWLFKLINQLKEKTDGEFAEIKVDAGVPTIFETTLENLRAAIVGENYEHTGMYPAFADIAEREGLPQIANRLRSIAVAESHHEERYTKLLRQLEGRSVFKKEEEVWWACRECGYVHFGVEPPDECPSCDHPKAYYEFKNEEY